MRKSLSLDNVTVAKKSPASKDDILPERIDEDEDTALEAETYTDTVDSPAVTDPQYNDSPEREEAGSLEEREAETRLAVSCNNLPTSSSLRRNKSVSRSLVPRMRKMFEKSRSCDPDLGEDTPPAPTHPAVPDQRHRRRLNGRDGTESATSSFILLDGTDPSTLAVDEVGRFSPADDRTPPPGDRKAKGFVNKCVTKVKSFIGKSED